MSEDDRRGGALTFCVFLLLAAAFMFGAAVQAGTGAPSPGVVITFVVILSTGAVIGAFVGFYNLGRKRGR